MYNETAATPTVLPIGALMQPLIIDSDNNDLFLLYGGVVRLNGALDGTNETLGLLPNSLPAGIDATGML